MAALIGGRKSAKVTPALEDVATMGAAGGLTLTTGKLATMVLAASTVIGGAAIWSQMAPESVEQPQASTVSVDALQDAEGQEA